MSSHTSDSEVIIEVPDWRIMLGLETRSPCEEPQDTRTRESGVMDHAKELHLYRGAGKADTEYL